jgi:aminopeptidase N
VSASDQLLDRRAVLAIVHKPLTRAEAAARAGLLTVHSYAVELDLTRGAEVFGSTSVIRFGCAEPSASSFVEVRPAALHRVVLNGSELDPATLTDGRLALSELEAANELRLEAEMAYTHTGEGMHRFADPADGEVYVYTQCGPAETPRVFGCFDQPDLKAVVSMTVIAPAGWTVLSNAAGHHRDGRWVFEDTVPISTYLVAVVAGPMESVHAEHDGVPLGLHARRSLAPYLESNSAEILDVTRRSFDRYHELFEERYPFGKYDQVFVPEFNWGAVENPGCVTFCDEFLYRAAATETERLFRGVVVAHELAHMWFGDLVTMRWWDDLWLNESFAEYMGYQVVTETTTLGDGWTAFAAARKPWGYDADQRASTHPVAGQDIDDAAAALANFDGISYAKGAAALRQLVAWVGDQDFVAGVNDYFARHRFGNASLTDLIASLAEASGRDVQAWTESWLRTSGVDTLRTSLSGDPVESAALEAGSRPHRILVGAYDLRNGRLTLRERRESETGPLPWLVGQPRPDLLLPNDLDLGYVKIRLDDRSWQTVTRSLSTVEDALTRAVLWNTARDMVRDGDLSAPDYLALVGSHLPDESHVTIVEAVLRVARHEVADRYLDPAERPAAVSALADVCRRLLAGPDGVRLAAVRGLIENSLDIAELRDWLRKDRGPDGTPLDAELRWTVVRRLAAAGAAGEPEFAAELARDPSVTGQQQAAYCRAALPTAAAKEQAWQRLFASSELSRPQLTATAEGFWQPDQRELTSSYVTRYFAELPAAGDRGAAVAHVLGSQLFPRYATTPRTIRLAEECLARDDLSGPLRRALSDQLDDLRRTVR